jgi:peptidoglycan/LPS O-acetylase OafA/YrhL
MRDFMIEPAVELNDQSTLSQRVSPPRQLERKSGYIPTLDGWRTIAVCGVILYHAPPIHFGFLSLAPIQNFGDRGVQLFFAISGILICSRLLEEQRMCGQISLQGFYLRRIFRIQPAALMFLFTIAVLGLIGTLHPSLPATLSSAFSYRNWWNALDLPVSPDDRYTVHFWSLAVEEQFYLMLPLLLVVGRKHLLKALIPITLLAVIWPPLAHHFGLTGTVLSAQRTDLSIRDLLVPALLAVALTQSAFRQKMVQLTRHGRLIWIVLLAILVSEILLGKHLTSLITCAGFPLIIVSTMMHPGTWLGRILESPLFVFGGRISYSVYLWQQLFFLHRPESSWLRFLQVTPVNVIATLCVATASYYLIEKPLMRLGHRLAPPATPGRKDLR